MVRTDIHRPGAINPSEYEWVAFEYIPGVGTGPVDLGACAFLQSERQKIRDHMARTGGNYSTHEHGGNCMVCGAWAIYTVLFYHRPTNVYVRTGQDCAQKMEMSYSASGYDLFKKNIHNVLEARAGKKKAEAILANAGLSRCWEIWEFTTFNGKNMEETTIQDVVAKLVKYGSISEKQTNLLRVLLNRIDHRGASVVPVVIAGLLEMPCSG